MGTCSKALNYKWCRSGNFAERYHETFKDDDGIEYCTFHTPISLRKKLNLNNVFQSYLKDAINRNQRDFSGCSFDKDAPLNLEEIQSIGSSTITLIDCHFAHPVKLSNRSIDTIILSGTVFEETVDFQNNRFMRDTNIEKSIFNNKCSFKGSSFEGKATFNGIEYQSLSFEDCSFLKDCTISWLKHVKRNCEENLAFDFNFHNVIIEKNKTIFFNHCYISNAIIKTRKEGSVEFGASSLSNVSFRGADLTRTTFFKVDLSECFFGGAELSGTRFSDCDFGKQRYLISKRFTIFDEVFLQSIGSYNKKGYVTFENFAVERSTSLRDLEETYCSLKNNFELNKNYNYADMFHFSEMEMKRAFNFCLKWVVM